MNRDKQIEEMAKDFENHTCMSEFQAEIASRMLYAKGYRKSADVAREIFEEIEGSISHIINHKLLECQRHYEHNSYTQMLQAQISILRILLKYIAELKKKYTEGCDG